MMKWLPWIIALLAVTGFWAVLWHRNRVSDSPAKESSGTLAVILIIVVGSVAAYVLITTVLGNG
jgi:hypothetical protein